MYTSYLCLTEVGLMFCACLHYSLWISSFTVVYKMNVKDFSECVDSLQVYVKSSLLSSLFSSVCEFTFLSRRKMRDLYGGDLDFELGEGFAWTLPHFGHIIHASLRYVYIHADIWALAILCKLFTTWSKTTQFLILNDPLITIGY